MNQHKSKALRRAAKQIAAQFPGVHDTNTYRDIVRQTIERINVPLPPTLMQKLRRMFGKTPPVPTKRVDKVTKETRQLVLSSGPKFILRRLKAALRRGEITITPSGMIEAVDNPYRHITRIGRDL
jgi:hypothetical protein